MSDVFKNAIGFQPIRWWSVDGHKTTYSDHPIIECLIELIDQHYGLVAEMSLGFTPVMEFTGFKSIDDAMEKAEEIKNDICAQLIRYKGE